MSIEARGATHDDGRTIEPIPLASIGSSGRNPRRRLTDVDELAASIEAYGLLQPVVARRVGDRFVLIAGHRRAEAARRLGWSTVPAIVRDESEDEAYLLTLIENLQREDLSPREEAAALEVLVRERNWSTRQVAAAVKRSQAYISKRLRVFEDPILAPAVLANQLSVSTAEELLAVPEDRRYELLYEAIKLNWGQQQVRAASRRGTTRTSATSRRPRGLTNRIRALRTDLRQMEAHELTEADRRELRLLFADLTMLARAPAEKRNRVFPPLPNTQR